MLKMVGMDSMKLGVWGFKDAFGICNVGILFCFTCYRKPLCSLLGCFCAFAKIRYGLCI